MAIAPTWNNCRSVEATGTCVESLNKVKKVPSAPAFIESPPSSSTHPTTEASVPPLATSVVEPASRVRFNVAEVSRSRNMLAETWLCATVVRPRLSYVALMSIAKVV